MHCKVFSANAIPDKAFVNEIYSHSLEKLLGIAGLLPDFTTDSRANPSLAAAWGIASKWTETSRYLLWDAISAGSLVTAIGDPQNESFNPSLAISEIKLVRTDYPLLEATRDLIKTPADAIVRAHFKDTSVNGTFIEMLILRSS